MSNIKHQAPYQKPEKRLEPLEVEISRLEMELEASLDFMKDGYQKAQQVLGPLNDNLTIYEKNEEGCLDEKQMHAYIAFYLKVWAQKKDIEHRNWALFKNVLSSLRDISLSANSEESDNKTLKKILQIYEVINWPIAQKKQKKSETNIGSRLSNLFFSKEYIEYIKKTPEDYFYIVKNLAKEYRNHPEFIKELCVDWFKYILIREKDAAFKYNKYFDNIGGKALILDFCKKNESLLSNPKTETYKALVNFCTEFKNKIPQKLEAYLNIEDNLSAEIALGFDFNREDERKNQEALSEKYWTEIFTKLANKKEIFLKKIGIAQEKIEHCYIYPVKNHKENHEKYRNYITPSDFNAQAELQDLQNNQEEIKFDIKDIFKIPFTILTIMRTSHINVLLHDFNKISKALKSSLEKNEDILPSLIFALECKKLSPELDSSITKFIDESLSYLMLVAPESLELLKSKNSWFIWRIWIKNHKSDIQNNPNIRKIFFDIWGGEHSVPQPFQSIYNPKNLVKTSADMVRRNMKKVIPSSQPEQISAELSPEKKAELAQQKKDKEKEKTFASPVVKSTDDPYVFIVSGLKKAQEKNANIILRSTVGIIDINEKGQIDLSEFKNKNHKVAIKLWFGLSDQDPAKYHPRTEVMLPQFKKVRVLDKTPVGVVIKNSPEKKKLSEKEKQQHQLFTDLERILNNSFIHCLEGEKPDFVNEKGCVFTLSSKILKKYPLCKDLKSFGYDYESEKLFKEEALVSDLTDILELLSLEIMDEYQLEIKNKEEQKKKEVITKKRAREKNNYRETQKFLTKFPELNDANKLFLGSTPESFKNNKGFWTWHFFVSGQKYKEDCNNLKKALKNQEVKLSFNTQKREGLKSIILQLGTSKVEISCDKENRAFQAQTENKDENYNKLFALGRQIFAYMAIKTVDPKTIKTIEERINEASWKTNLINLLNDGTARASNGDFYKPSEPNKDASYFIKTGKRICAVRAHLKVATNATESTIKFHRELYEEFRQTMKEHESFKKYFLLRVIETYRFSQEEKTEKTIFTHPSAVEIIDKVFSDEKLNSDISPHELLDRMIKHGQTNINLCDYLIDKFEQKEIGISLQGEVSYTLAELQEFSEREDLPLYMPAD